MGREFLFTSESVTEGHPDKICDQISDALVDAFISQDPDSRIAIEAMITTDFIAVAGEVTTRAQIDPAKQEEIVRKTVRDIGYDDPALKFDADSCKVLMLLHPQSPDISRGVNSGEGQGAGDQGLMFGYACNETDELMPMPIMLAHAMTRRLAELRKSGQAPWMRPDGKSQVSVRYDVNHRPVAIESVVVSIQHDEDTANDVIREFVIGNVVKPVCGSMWSEEITIHVNPTGKFVIGGPHGDAGLTGRKIIVDTYGGFGRHGGGAFSGKDPSKVDRSACYMCRYVAKNIVAAGLASRCEVQVAYAIGVAEPVSLMVNTFGTGTVPDAEIERRVGAVFDMRPSAIISRLELKRPIYAETAAYGHFGRSGGGFAWERTDAVDRLKQS